MLKVFKAKEQLIKDFTLNFLASVLTTGITQLLVYPFLSRMISAEEYGVMLTIMGVANTLIASLGNSLNNVRLMVNTKYDETNQQGDFLPIMLLLSLIGAIAYTAYLIIFQKMQNVYLILLVFFVVAGIIRNYGSVVYRLILDYKKNLIFNFFIAFGNVIGIILMYSTKKLFLWPLIFFLGEVIGVLYIHRSSNIYKESFSKTSLFNSTVGKEIVLLFTTLAANVLTYLDRLLVLPLLGGAAVSTYTVASFFGKSLGVLMTPMSSVLLSYYAQRDYKMTYNKFWKSNISVLLMTSSFFLICVFISDWGTGLFYPTLIQSARPYLLLANMAALLNIVGNMTTPAVLKYASTYWQIIVQGAYCATYLTLGVCLSKAFGLYGFSIAAFIAALLRVILLYIAGTIAIGEKNNDKKCM